MAWTLQRKQRAKGWYYEVLHRTGAGGKPRCITLGYLDDDAGEAARERLRAAGDALVPLADDVVRAWLKCEGEPAFAASDVQAIIDGTRQSIPPNYPFDYDGTFLGEGGVAVEIDASGRMRATEPIRRADRERSAAAPLTAPPPPKAVAAPTRTRGPTLRSFVETQWRPVRSTERAATTWTREWGLWSTGILPALGDVSLERLDLQKWQGFLASCTTWGPRTKQLAQVAYRTCLRYAVEIGTLEAEHGFRPIRGATVRKHAPPEPLTSAEVDTLLGAAGTPAHRCLFAVAIGQGLRPGEVVAIHHEDVDLTEGKESLYIRGGSKNAQARKKVPLTTLAIREIGRYRAELKASETAIKGPMFLWRGVQIRKFRSALRNASRRANLNEHRQRSVFPYLFRHSFATLSAVAGVPKAATRAMMRHTKHSEILEQAYEHLSPDQIRDAFASTPVFGDGGSEGTSS